MFSVHNSPDPTLLRPGSGFTFTKESAMRRGGVWLVACCVLFAACSGCGSKSDSYSAPTVPVKGKVTYKGKPLTQGEIVFEPDSGGREAHGPIQPDGSFELTTNKQGDGTVVGTHRVAVTGTSKKDGVPAKFKNVSSSKTEVEVAEGKSEYSIDFK
jgi:hypothetical protein